MIVNSCRVIKILFKVLKVFKSIIYYYILNKDYEWKAMSETWVCARSDEDALVIDRLIVLVFLVGEVGMAMV